MRYALLINELPGVFEALGAAEQESVSAEYIAIRSDPRVVDGAHLAPAHTASTVRVKEGDALVTDGPFADTKEVFGGYFLVEADDLDAAIEVATKIPAARLGGSVEIRPIVKA
ncbi:MULTISPECIES: YciI family protein [unclassified Nocardia]|uniref:YciI family protein n=1 Tax=unclassified Nocardia TaxID=2637762 RepID=UPI0034239A80